MKINKILNVVLVIVMSITSMLFGNRISKEERKGIEDEFKTKYGKHCTITWNEKTGTVSSIYGVKINIDSNDSSLNLAKLFIGDNNKLFGINDVDNDLKISKKIISKKRGNHFFFSQVINDIPIASAGYSISLTDNNEIYNISGHCYVDFKVNTTPSVSEDDAIQIVRNYYKDSIKIEGIELIVVPNEESNIFILAYQIYLNLIDGIGRYRYIINANSGEIINEWNMTKGVTGVGNIYMVNPDISTFQSQSLYRLYDNTTLLIGENANVWSNINQRAVDVNREYYYVRLQS